MEPLLGSVLQFSPATPGWMIAVTDGETEWAEPLVGWAVVVIWTAWQKDNEEEGTQGTKQFQTELQPVSITKTGEVEPLIMREGIEFVSVAMPGQVPL